jgi:hypothetical protein
MQTKRLKSTLLAGSLSTFAAAIAATAAVPTPVPAHAMQVAQTMRNPCGTGSPCAPGGRGAGPRAGSPWPLASLM